jgi:multidrug transporter EmrE-like cation transporter
MILIIIVITVLANMADLLLKVGANRAGESLSDPLAILLTPWIWFGAMLGISAMGLWVYILGRYHISHAYPIFVGLGFLNISLASWLFLDEEIGRNRLAGTVLILIGILVVHFHSGESNALRSAWRSWTNRQTGDNGRGGV